ncbi:hypothetical protein [Actinomycetospora sp. CA-053990]|uniref:hypothetical protein n=1 Tax=Actinomycetospora sp. CA-053990 TaxID=3239891 RepID=UPI003D911C16
MTATDLTRPSTPDPLRTVHTRRSTEGWRDELVELLVLSEHGDAVAARTLRTWIATDAAVRRVHAAIVRDVVAVRAARTPAGPLGASSLTA